jgi:hypothetical protein
MAKKRLLVKGNAQGIAKAERALLRLGFETKANFAKVEYLCRTTVTKFFTFKAIQFDKFKLICEVLSLDWQEIADLSQRIDLDSGTEKTNEFEPKYQYESALIIRNFISNNSPFKLGLKDYYLIEWVIGAALDNGLFSPGDLKKILSDGSDDEAVSSAYRELLELGIFQLLQVELAYLADIDDIVIHKLKEKFSLKGSMSLIRSNLKDLAQGKALRMMWHVEPDGVIYVAPKRDPEGMEIDTVRVIEETLTLDFIGNKGFKLNSSIFHLSSQPKQLLSVADSL